MRLAALSIGGDVPWFRLDGRVSALHHHACVLDGGSGQAVLVSADRPRLPNGAVLETPAGFRFTELGLRAGVRAVGTADGLRLGSATLQVDLGRARHYEGTVRVTVDLLEPSQHAAWWAARDVLAEHAPAGSLGELVRPGHTGASPLDGLVLESAFICVARAAAHDLWAAARRGQTSRIGPAVLRVAGLGAGATPAGDDLLVGFAAGLETTLAGHAKGRRVIGCFRRSLVSAAARTTAVSATYLRLAAVGRFSSAVTDPLAAIAAGDSQRAGAAVRSAVAVGHTSGADALTGLLIALGVTADGIEQCVA